MSAGKHTAPRVAVHEFLPTFAAFGTGIYLRDGRRAVASAPPDFTKQERNTESESLQLEK